MIARRRTVRIFLLTFCFILLPFLPVTAVTVNVDYGTSSEGSITAPGGVDTYTFSAEQNDVVVVRVSKTDGDLWPRITLYDPSGKELARKYSSSTSEITSELTESGTCRVLVDDGFQGNYVGDYTLFIQRVNAPRNVIPSNVGTPKTESINPVGSVDTYSFEGVKGNAIVLRISKTGGDLWPRITLYGPDGSELGRKYSSSTSEISAVLKESGAHTILVDDGFQGAYTGDYSLFYQLTSGPRSEGSSSTAPATTVLNPSQPSVTSAHTTTSAGTDSDQQGGWMGYVPLILIGLILVGAVVVAGRKLTRRRPTHDIRPSSTPTIPRQMDDQPKYAVVDHDVMISYASMDKPVADAVCAGLEARGIRCWIAPRDILAGTNYQEAIVDAINTSKVMVLIYSSHANDSLHVNREVSLALSKRVITIPFKVEDAPLSKSMEYLISVPHWLDALTPPLEKHIEELSQTVNTLLGRDNSTIPPK